MYRTLWLASWYPSEASSQNGDFIQRHAQAVSMFANVYVLHVVGMENIPDKVKKDERCLQNLTEEIIYYRKHKSRIIKGLFSFYQYVVLYKKNIRQYITAHGKPDIVHVHVSMRAGLLALWLKRKYNIPYVITEHWTIFTPERKDNFYTTNPLFKHFTRKVFKHAAAVLPVSNNLGKNIQRMVVNVPYIQVSNVVSSRFSYKETNNDRPFTFLHVSSLQELKNPKGILRAYKNLLQKEESILLKMIGKNCDKLITYAKALGIPDDKIIFTGEISNEAVAAEMQSADVFILFSLSETFGCVVAESLCCGVPVIAADVGGVSELLDENNGILIPSGEETMLVNAMHTMLQNYANYDRTIIAKQATALYNYNTIGTQIIDIYEKVIHK